MAARRPRRRSPAFAPTEEVESFAAGLPKRFLLCRTLQHNWSPWTARLADGGGFEQVLRCTRCHSERHQLLTPRGHVVSETRTYPDGYLHKGLGRIAGEGRDAIRLESITRQMGEPRIKEAS